ncbi:hypothetical protein [Zavarzinella formosa]|uniref:hypothetical protein n=1 Tax=Zavarzinella formosa TaxID=360055 RepID=UPI0002F69DDF|nr:hypothetical protein [Zavarzinella formosa]
MPRITGYHITPDLIQTIELKLQDGEIILYDLNRPLSVSHDQHVVKFMDFPGVVTAYIPDPLGIKSKSDAASRINFRAADLLADLTGKAIWKTATIRGYVVIIHRQTDGTFAGFPDGLVKKILSHA